MTDAIDRQLANLLIGESAVMRRVRDVVRKVARSPIPVLIQGPTGSGKELVAQALHVASGRAGAFVAFNVCAVADGMFEDALFGHVRGAYTGAIADAAGYLTEADRGTVFLDEISGLPLASQAKLLRAIETREFRPVGGRSDRRSDFRLVTATNEALADAVTAGRFRSDLLFRLRGTAIQLPSVRERVEDIPALARHFAARSVTSSGHQPVLSEDAVELLAELEWPGNVRELKAAIDCAVALTDGRVVTRADMLRSASGSPRRRNDSSLHRRSFATRRLIDVLEQACWDVEAAARVLGVHRATIYRRLNRMDREKREAIRTPEHDDSAAPGGPFPPSPSSARTLME